MASERLFGRLAVVHHRRIKNPDLFSTNQPFLPLFPPFFFFTLPGIYTCSAQGVWMNEVLGRSQPTCLPGTWLSSSLPPGLPSKVLWLLMEGVWGPWCFGVLFKRYIREPKIEKPSLTPLKTNQPLYLACAITPRAFLSPFSAVLLLSHQAFPPTVCVCTCYAPGKSGKWHPVLQYSLCQRRWAT